jgi:hypothetical protein
MIKYGLISLMILTGCTYNVSLIHTEGEASDVIDTVQEASPDVKPQIQIPVKPL